jgi:hypothetical protein
MRRKKSATKMTIAELRARRRQTKSAILHDVRNGMKAVDAASVHGVSRGTLWQWCFADKVFGERIKAARKARIRRAKKIILAEVRAGKLFKDSVKEGSVTAGTVQFWRKRDRVFDAAVQAALKASAAKRRRLAGR